LTLQYDQFGVLKIYKTLPDGDEWYASWDTDPRTLHDGDRDPDDSRFLYTNGSPDIGLFIETDGHARLDDLGAGTTSSARLWVEKSDESEGWLNTEMTVYAKRMNLAADIQLRSRSNHTTSATPNCKFGNYEVTWNDDQKACILEVEVIHPLYKRRINPVPWVGFTNNVYQGFKQVTRTVGDKVHVEGYWNPTNGDESQWQRMNEFWFDGKNIEMNPRIDDIDVYLNCLGKGDKLCEDLNASTRRLLPGQWCWLRVNNVDQFRFKKFSVREIYAG
jgi:hypothetical protein